MKFNCTGVILAGGKNSRLPGKKKGFRKVGNLMILEKIYDLFSKIFKEVIIVVNEPEAFADWDMTIVTDIDKSQCALSGLHAGLFYASYPYAYVTACDTPFIKQSVIEYIVDQYDAKFDVVLPETDEGLETLSAVYSKECIPLIERNLKNNIYMIKKFFRKKKVRYIPVKQLKQFDPDVDFIFNVNTPEDLETAQTMMKKYEN